MQRFQPSTFRMVWRFVLAVLWILFSVLPVTALWLMGAWRWRAYYVSLFYRVTKRLMGLHVEVIGTLSKERPLMLVSNHCSYVDVFVLGALSPMSFTPKREVRSWPLIGYLCVMADCIFVERKRSEIKAAREEMHRKLSAGRVVTIFPEGTTNNGDELKPFKSGFFSLAEDTFEGQPLQVQAATITYTHIDGQLLKAGGDRDAIAWYGDMEFGSHFAALFGLGQMRATITLHDPVSLAAFKERKALAAHCEKQVQATLQQQVKAVV